MTLAVIKKDRERIFSFLLATVPVLLGMYVFLMPIPHATTIKEICYYLAAVLVLVLVYSKRIFLPRRTPLALPLLFFLSWCVVGLFFAINRENSLHDLYAHFLKYIFLYFMLVIFFSSTRKLSILSRAIVVSSVILFLGCLYYYYGVLGRPLTERYGLGFRELPTNQAGILALFAVSLGVLNISQAKDWGEKLFFSCCILPALAIILLAQTRSVLLALLVSVVVVFSSKKRLLLGILLLVGLVVAVSPVAERFKTNLSGIHRVKMGLIAWEVVKDYPLTGIGFGMRTFGYNLDLPSYNAKLPEKFQGQEIVPDPHNMYTDIAVRTGIPGLLFFCWFIFTFFRMGRVLRRDGASGEIMRWSAAVFASGLSFFVIGFFEPVFSHYSESILCLILAMGTILWRIREDGKALGVAEIVTEPSGGKKKIAVVIPKYGLVGGGEQFAMQLTEKIAQNPLYDVHVFANQWKAVSGKVSFHSVPMLRFPRFLTTLSFAFFANAAIARQKFDLVHTHDRIFHADLFTMHGVPHRFWVREVRRKRMSLFDRATAWVEQRLIADHRCRFLLPVSSLAMEKFSQEFEVAPSRMKVIHPGIEFARFNLPNRAEKREAIRRKFGICAGDLLVLFVGMNFELKGLETLIFALAKARMSGKGMKLLVVGKGNQSKYLRIAADLGVGEDIVFAGVQSEGIEGMYAAGDVCALLSGFDTFGMTILEAMAASLPVIISTQVGAKDIVTDGEHGFIVDKDDAETVSTRLVSLCEDEKLRARMGRAAMQRAAQHSWDEVARKVVTIYEELLS